jgi:hypothetical protein
MSNTNNKASYSYLIRFTQGVMWLDVINQM